MAIKIPIITIFDNKGLRAAQHQLNKVSGSFNALGRNFAIGGAAIGAVAVGLGAAVKAASNFEAEFEGVNQVFGTAAKSVQAFAKAASDTAGLSETAALQGAKTFGLFAKSAGLGQEEAAKFSTSLVQLAGDLGSFNDVPTEEALAAIQSGLMGQAEPLRRFGVFLTDTKLRAEAQAMAIYDGTGALNDQQKMLASYSLIMKDTQIQQGDFVKYQDTFGNAFKTVQTDIQNITKDIGMELLPIVAQITPIIGDLASELGDKLATAVKAVDWASLLGSLVDLLTFIVTNIETITKVATALFVLNTAFNAVRAASGLYNAVAVILNTTLLRTAVQAPVAAVGVAGVGTAAGTASIGVGLFSAALRLIPGAALLAWIGFMVQGMTEVDSAYRQTTPVVTSFGSKVLKTGKDSEWAAKKYGVATQKVGDYANSANAVDGISFSGHRMSIGQIASAWKNAQQAAKNYKKVSAAGLGGATADRMDAFLSSGKKKGTDGSNTESDVLGGAGTAAKKKVSPLKALKADLAKSVKIGNLSKKLVTQKGFSEGLAGMILGGKNPIKTAKKILDGTAKGVKKLKNLYAKSAAGIAEATSSQSSREPVGEATLSAEEIALNQRKENYKSFLESVKSTFSQIRESILGAFTLPTLGSSTDSILRNMGKLLSKTRDFASNITRLSSMGLDPALLQQIISEGPIAGARLAAALVSGGVDGLTAINTGYAEIAALSTGIATTGVNAAFGGQQQQNIYNIEVNGGVGSGATIGQAIVDAIKAYERTSGAVWQGA
jgi:hypothetical protein